MNIDKLLIGKYGFAPMKGRPFRSVLYKEKPQKVKYTSPINCCPIESCVNHKNRKRLSGKFCPDCGAETSPQKWALPKVEDKEPIDVHQFTHMLRIHEQHYLMYSMNMGAFSLCYKFEQPKGEAGGGYRKWNVMSVPVVAREEEDIINLLKGFKINGRL